MASSRPTEGELPKADSEQPLHAASSEQLRTDSSVDGIKVAGQNIADQIAGQT